MPSEETLFTSSDDSIIVTNIRIKQSTSTSIKEILLKDITSIQVIRKVYKSVAYYAFCVFGVICIFCAIKEYIAKENPQTSYSYLDQEGAHESSTPPDHEVKIIVRNKIVKDEPYGTIGGVSGFLGFVALFMSIKKRVKVSGPFNSIEVFASKIKNIGVDNFIKRINEECSKRKAGFV